jgi:hypothetical protein
MYLQDHLRFRRNLPLTFPKTLCVDPCISILRLPPMVARHVIRSAVHRMAQCHLGERMQREGSVHGEKDEDIVIALKRFQSGFEAIWF